MHVIGHEPHAWFLFQAEEALLLDVNCNHGAAGYSVMIRLNAEEASEYSSGGHAFLNGLAQAVQDAAPGNGYQSRDLSASFAKESLAAVNEWRTARNDN
jgi:hypothetical protein